MPIKRSSEQQRKTLTEFYIDLSATSTNSYVDIGKEMLNLVQLIDKTFEDTLIWGLTSHDRLVIKNADDWKAPWYIIISNIGTKEYYFEYLLPTEKQPWENAYVRGQANNIEEAKRYLLIAMDKCEGWTDNLELKKLLLDNNI
jgi:hypothetical protein